LSAKLFTQQDLQDAIDLFREYAATCIGMSLEEASQRAIHEVKQSRALMTQIETEKQIADQFPGKIGEDF